MKLIIELIEFALRRNLLTEENKRKLQENGFYTFYEDNDDEYQRDSEDIREDELDRTYYGDLYTTGKRHNGKRKSSHVGPELTVEELNQRVEEEWKKLTEEFSFLEPLWDSWKTGKLERVLADGFTLNDIYALTKVERRDYHDCSGPAPTAYRQLLRQVGNVMGKYSWVIKSPETAAMVEFPIFRQQVFEEVRALYETDCEKFAALSSQNGKLNFPFWEKAVQTDTTSMKVWTILNLSAKPVTPERIEEVQTWKPELAIAMQLNLDYITKLVQRDWSSLTVITECDIENTILKSVSIPEGVTAHSVAIPEGVTAIGDEAFEDCSSLTSVVIPEGVTAIGEWAFAGCRSLTSVVIPDGVKEIGSYAFLRCSSLTSVVIPEGVKEIGRGAFYDCSSLTSVSIPDSVDAICGSTFCGCRALKEWSVSSTHPYFKSDGVGLLTRDGKMLVACLASATKYRIPEGVTTIGNYAFDCCSSLTSVVIPEGVKEIGNYAFAGCSSLMSVTIPEGVKEIGWGAFCGCSSLTSVVIPDGVTTIESKAFAGCSSLTSVVIPDGVTTIESDAFEDCSSLTSVVIPEGVKEIGSYAFLGCSSLTSVAIPEGVKKIGYETFSGCSSLTSVVIPDGVKEIGWYAFRGCSSLTSVIIPEGVTTIESEAFENCPKLTIHAPAGSYAEKYANGKNIPFQPLEEEK